MIRQLPAARKSYRNRYDTEYTHGYGPMVKRTLEATYRIARRIVVGVIGFSVLLLGVVMLITPGPALVVIPVGLGILSLEFAWARHWLRTLRRKIEEQGGELRSRWAQRKARPTDETQNKPDNKHNGSSQ